MPDAPMPNGSSQEFSPVSVSKLPPHPLDGQWYMHVEGQTYGPFTGQQLKEFANEGRLTPATDVIKLGSDVWMRASEDAALNSFFALRRQAPPMADGTAAQVSAAQGATIVQVTNTISSPRTPNVFIDDGIAKPKSAGTALLLSFLIVGSGQLYNGQIAKGILMLIGCVILWFVLLGWTINLWSMIDAYITARNMNERYQKRLAAGMIL